MGTSLPAAFETAQTDANCKFARLHRQPVKDRSSLSFVTVTVSMAMAMLRLDYNGIGEGVPNVRLVNIASNHDELADLLLVGLPRSDHLFVRAVHDGMEGYLLPNALDGEDRLDPHDEPVPLRHLRQGSHQAGQGLLRHLAVLLAADGVHTRVVARLLLRVAVVVIAILIVTIVLVVPMIPVAMTMFRTMSMAMFRAVAMSM